MAIVWSGQGTSRSWSDPQNWAGGVVPTEDEDVVINQSTAEPGTDVLNAVFNSLTVSAGANLTVGAVTFIAKSVINAGTIIGASHTPNRDANGVEFQRASSSLTNSGTITGDFNGDGVRMVRGGAISNSAGGIITGGNKGVGSEQFFPGTITNAGTISGTSGDGVAFDLGGTVTNSGSGVIAGGTDGIQSRGASATITNDGTIRSNASAGIGVLFSDSLGVFANTLTNSGTIIGNSAAAVQFGAGDDTLKLLPGAKFTGVVDGGGGKNTLELASGTSAGHLSEIGTAFTNFGTLLLDSGKWTLTGDGNDGLGHYRHQRVHRPRHD